jgi:hypothetical protein
MVGGDRAGALMMDASGRTERHVFDAMCRNAEYLVAMQSI